MSHLRGFLKSKNIQAAIISGSISIIIGVITVSINSCLVRDSNNTAKKAFDLADKVYKSKEIPRLIAYPIGAKFYLPNKPEVSGQVKINISAIIQNLSEVNAREISINFETEDWYGHKTNLFDIYKIANLPIPHFLSLPKNANLIYPSYAPDAPASGEAGFISQDKPFKLKLTLWWKDINNAKYVYVGFFNLKSAILPDNNVQLYFQPINTYDSINDGKMAWDYAEKKL